jgi:hypothetical protein
MSGGPPTILRRVVSVIVSAIQGQPVGSWPHVGVERFEAVAPAVADGDTAATVVLPFRVLGITAALFHRVPNGVFRCVIEAVSCIRFTNAFIAETATALCVTFSQRINDDCLFGAAITATVPIRTSVFARAGLSTARRGFQDSQAAEAQASSVKFMHSSNCTALSRRGYV